MNGGCPTDSASSSDPRKQGAIGMGPKTSACGAMPSSEEAFTYRDFSVSGQCLKRGLTRPCC